MKSPERSPDDVNATQIRKTVAEIIDRLGIANSLRAVANDCRLHETDANQHPNPEMATAWRQAGLQIGHLAQELEPSLANQRASEPAKPEEMSNQANELVRTLGIAKAILAIANNCLRRAKDTDHPENTDLAVSWQNTALHTGRLSHALEGSIADHPAPRNHGDNPVRRPEDETLGWIPHHSNGRRQGPLFNTKTEAQNWIAKRSIVDLENWFIVRDSLARRRDRARAAQNETAATAAAQ